MIKWLDEHTVRDITLKDPVTGTVLKGSSWNDISKKWLKFLAAENRPITAAWRAEMDALICAQNKKAPCREVRDKGQKSIGRLQIESFARASLRWINARRFAPPEEAERRAAICASCEHNVKIARGCARCWKWIDYVIGKIKRIRTSKDDKLEACLNCECPLKLKVHVPAEALKDDPFSYPDHCWIPGARDRR